MFGTTLLLLALAVAAYSTLVLQRMVGWQGAVSVIVLGSAARTGPAFLTSPAVPGLFSGHPYVRALEHDVDRKPQTLFGIIR